MNNQDVVTKVAQKTGENIDTCERIIKAFEQQSEQLLENKLKGVTNDHDNFIGKIAEQTNCSKEVCEKVVRVIDEVIDTGLSNKLKFIKRK